MADWTSATICHRENRRNFYVYFRKNSNLASTPLTTTFLGLNFPNQIEWPSPRRDRIS